MKRFQEWFARKEKLDAKSTRPPPVSEGDVWWTGVGENIGAEIGGKNDKFTRPVLIFKKLNSAFYAGLPLTTQPHFGPWYVRVRLNGKDQFVCLHQIQAVDYRRLDEKFGKVDENQFEKIKRGFSNLYINDKPRR